MWSFFPNQLASSLCSIYPTNLSLAHSATDYDPYRMCSVSIGVRMVAQEVHAQRHTEPNPLTHTHTYKRAPTHALEHARTHIHTSMAPTPPMTDAMLCSSLPPYLTSSCAMSSLMLLAEKTEGGARGEGGGGVGTEGREERREGGKEGVGVREGGKEGGSTGREHGYRHRDFSCDILLT